MFGKKRTYVVTGAASGIGAATVKYLAEHGARVITSAFQHIGILSLEFHVDKLSRPLL